MAEKTWFCLASGPSMTTSDAELVRGSGKVIAVNNTIRHAPWADVLYACDAKWWRTYSSEDRAPDWWRPFVPLVRDFAGQRVCLRCEGIPTPDGVEAQRWEHGNGLGRECIHAGSNGGYQAINYAYLQGARRIVLLGYDMQATGGRAHWHEDHPRGMGNFTQHQADLCRPNFDALARDLRDEGVRVINASRSTALTCFERMPLKRALKLI